MFNFANIDLSKLPELSPRHRWGVLGGNLQISAVGTKWYDAEEEVIYLMDTDGNCKYWKLFGGSLTGHWEFGGKADNIDTGVKLLTAWCLVGIADYTFRD